MVERHRRKTATMSYANNRRLFAGRSRANHLVVLSGLAFAQVIRQFFEVTGDLRDAVDLYKLEARLETVQQGRWARTRLPCERAAIPALFEVEVVIRVRHAGPANQG